MTNQEPGVNAPITPGNLAEEMLASARQLASSLFRAVDIALDEMKIEGDLRKMCRESFLVRVALAIMQEAVK